MATTPINYGNKKFGHWNIYVIAIALTLVACAVAVVLRLFSAADLPFQTFAALIGVIITAIITGILLKGQSDAEREQKERAEIFKEKLASYNKFIDALCAYVTDSTSQNKKALTFHTIALKMHSTSEDMAKHYHNVTAILASTGNKQETAALVNALNEIATSFRSELYGYENDDDLSLRSIIADFTKAIEGSQEEPSDKEREDEIREDENEDKSLSESSLPAWDTKLKELAALGWNIETAPDMVKLSSAKTPVVISIYRKKGKYVIEATNPGDSDFSQRLKDSFKGSRRYGTWWRELPISNYGVTEGTLVAQLPTNARARASVIKWIDKLLQTI